MLQMIRDWRDLTRFNDLNVVFIAWDSDDKDDRGVVKKMVSFTPSMQRQYPGIVDSIGWVSPTTNPDLRMVDFTPGPKTHAKFRRAPHSRAMKIPYVIYYGINNLPMPDILAVLKGGSDWPTSKYPSPVRGNAAS
jgi:hypothetical protein